MGEKKGFRIPQIAILPRLINVGFAGKTNVIHRGPTLLKDLRMCANILFLDTPGHVQRLLRKILVQFSVRHG